MRSETIVPALLLAMLSLASCGADDDSRLSLSGSVRSDPGNMTGPFFIALANTTDLAEIERDPLSAIVELINVDGNDGSFSIDLSQSSLRPGDEISIIAFADSDYRGGVPYPTEGDFVGLYVDGARFTMGYRLLEGPNDDIDITINRRVYDFEATVSGTLAANGPSDCVLIAYAGDIDSFDFSSLDFNAVIGYRRIGSGELTSDYSMKILPYGFDVPVSGVYLLALFDRNGNGLPDAGDGIGYYSEDPSGLPTLITIEPGRRTGLDIVERLRIPAPSGQAVSIAGSFEAPAGYDADAPPVFVIVAESNDPNAIFDDPLSAIRYFRRLPRGESSFDLDLSATGLSPGDEVMLLVLWDRDYVAGFPGPTAGDYAGFYQNNDELRNTVALQPGETTIRPGGDNWSFALKRKIFDHGASVSFMLDPGGLPDYGDANRAILVAVHKNGLDLLQMQIADMNYIVGMVNLPLDFTSEHTMKIFPALYCDPDTGSTISGDPFELGDIYLLAILDNNPANGGPDSGEYLGYYYTRLGINPFYIYLPATFTVTNGPVTLPRAVRFTGQRY